MTFDTFRFILPEFLLVLLAGLVLWLDVAWPESRRRVIALVAAGGFLAVLVATLIFAQPLAGAQANLFGGMLRADNLAFIFRLVFFFSGFVVALLSVDAPGLERRGDYYAMLIVAVFGMNLMVASADLIMLYLAIETTSVALYMLAGFRHDDNKSTESGLKYFLFGAFTSTVMLYGFSLLYGFTGQTNFAAVQQVLSTGAVPAAAVIVSILLMLVGFGFKISAFPFHFWSPDVYEGAPTPVTGFISVASKAAGFVVFLRVLVVVLPDLQAFWTPLLVVISGFTMTIGNVIALSQKNIKRLLAYSSIAQAGYALIGLATNTAAGVAATSFYLILYTVTNLVAFAVIVLAGRLLGSDEIKDYAGLSRRSPGLALAFMVAFLSLGGMPPFAGFFGKFFLFAAAVQQATASQNNALMWLVVVGILNAIVGIYYYLTVLKVVYLYRSENDQIAVEVPRAYSVALWVCVAGVLIMGTLAGPWINWATQAAGALF